MATLRLGEIKPFAAISQKTSPEPLRWALREVFSQSGEGIWLVGGTALAGYYAEHRRSDDLDLFAISSDAHRAAVLATRALGKSGAKFTKETSTPNFYKG